MKKREDARSFPLADAVALIGAVGILVSFFLMPWYRLFGNVSSGSAILSVFSPGFLNLGAALFLIPLAGFVALGAALWGMIVPDSRRTTTDIIGVAGLIALLYYGIVFLQLAGTPAQFAKNVVLPLSAVFGVGAMLLGLFNANSGRFIRITAVFFGLLIAAWFLLRIFAQQELMTILRDTNPSETAVTLVVGLVVLAWGVANLQVWRVMASVAIMSGILLLIYVFTFLSPLTGNTDSTGQLLVIGSAVIAGASTLWALFRPETRQMTVPVAGAAGLVTLIFFTTFFFVTPPPAAISGPVNLGFIVAVAGAVLLIAQLVIPREGQELGLTTRWIYDYVVFPIGQMILFIAGAALLMTVIAYGLSVFFPEPRENIVLSQQINRQLPGMIISGITIGFVYAMIALGYTVVYGVLKFINFAHSEIFMVGGVVGFEVMQRISAAGTGDLQAWSPVLLVITVVGSAMIVSGLLAVAIERVAYRPLRGAPRLVPLISAIGVSLFLTDFVRAAEAITRNEFNLTYPLNGLAWIRTPIPVQFGETLVTLRPTQFIVIIGAVLTLLILNYFVNGTKLGRGIRAVSQDMPTAGLMGIDVNRMVSLTFFVGGSFGGAAGALFGMNVGTITPFVGFFPGIKAFTAAVLGGIGSITGALLGGLALGMIESFLNGVLVYFPLFGQRYTDIFAFSVLILILIFRPSGLLGERVDEKV